MASKISINLDTSKENFLVNKCKQNDDLTLEAYIYENGAELNLTNKEIIIQALKSDNTYIIQNTEIVKENNKILAELDRDFSRVSGTTKIEILLVESGKQNTTFSFYLEVSASVISGAVESSNTVTILEALNNKIIETGQVLVEAIQVKEDTEQLIESGGAATTGDIANINAQLEQKAQKTQVDTLQNQINNFQAQQTSGMTDTGSLELVATRTNSIGINHKTSSKRVDNIEYLLQKGKLKLEFDWEVGEISNNSGGNLTTGNKIRTINYYTLPINNKIYLNINSNYKINVYKYDSSNGFKGYSSYGGSLETNAEINIENFKYKFSVEKTGDTVGNLDYLNNILIELEFKQYSIEEVNKLKSDFIDMKNKKIGIADTEFFNLNRANLFNKNDVLLNKQISETGGIVDYDGYIVSQFIEITPSSTFYYKNNGARYALYDNSYNFISRSGYQATPIITTENTKFIRIMFPSSSLDTQFISLDNYYSNYDNYNVSIVNDKLAEAIQNIKNNNGNILSGKKWLVIGDSVSDTSGSGAIAKYDTYISNETGIIVTNNGVSGTGYLATASGTKLDFCQRVDNLTGNEGYDYITIFGHINDSGGSFTLGTFGDTTKDTLAGAIYYAIDKLTQKFPNAKIGIITANPTSWSRNGIFYNVSEIIKQTCKYFSVPCLDFFASSGMNPYNATWKTQWFLDETHPNTNCHKEYIAPKIKRFLESL